MTYHTTNSSYVKITEDMPDRIDTISKAVRRTPDCLPSCTDGLCNTAGSMLMGVKFVVNKNCISCNESSFEYQVDN